MLRISILLLTILVYGCSEKPTQDYSSVRIGMTYDEVEGIIGRPVSIGRGASKISGTNLSVSYAEWEAVDISTQWPGQPSSWKVIDYIPGEVETIGGLIYVRWDYSQSRRDTIYYRAIRRRSSGIDSFFVPIEIQRSLSVVFDASSGRVARAGFFPISIRIDTPFRLPSIRPAL